MAELLRKSKGTLELVDARSFLPLFKARAGLSSWAVLNDYHAIQKEIQKRRDGKASDRFELKKKQQQFELQQVQETEQDQKGGDDNNDNKPSTSSAAKEVDIPMATTETSFSSSSSSSFLQTLPPAAIQHDDDPTIQACLDMGE